MATTRRTQPSSEPAARAERGGAELALAATRGTATFLGIGAGMLREVDGVTRAFIQRRREAVQETQRALEELQSCRDPIEAMKVQQRWLSESLQRLASEMGELGVMTLTLSQRAWSGMWEESRAVGEDVQRENFALAAAGEKPARGRRRAE